ncbi:MAG: amidohydrolase family protein, partial [Sulfuritalea sp.]|nr:amidohydrolase family protein [Sulfuritalea sp.]
ILDAHAEHLRLAAEIGVPLLVGTDAGSMGVEHGHALFDEIDRFLEAGVALDAVLTAATTGARRRFGSKHPRLEVGSPFNAVSFKQSPFVNVAVLRQPIAVWRSGQNEVQAAP